MAEITLERVGNVAVVTLDAPERRNALTEDMSRALVEACDEIDRDETIGAALVRGRGHHFCAGAHRELLAAAATDPTHANHYRALGSIYEAFYRFGNLAVPTVAALRGAAVGAGVNLMLAADLRVIAEDATVAAGFLSIGLHPGGGFFHLAERAAGWQAAAALGIFGERLTGARAAELGLAWQAVPDEQVEEHALALATMASRDAELTRVALRCMREELSAGVPWPVALQYERAPQMWSLRRRQQQTSEPPKQAGRHTGP